MSTRSQIFIDGVKASIYRHSDGYPEGEHGVLAWLEAFAFQFRKNRGWDPNYMLARALETGIRETGMAFPECSHGWGIEDEEHGDLSYAYVIHEDFSITVHKHSRSTQAIQTVHLASDGYVHEGPTVWERLAEENPP